MSNIPLEYPAPVLDIKPNAVGERGFPLRLFFELFIPVALLIGGGAWFVARDRITETMDLIRADEINNVVLGVRRLDGELLRPLQQLRALAREEATLQAINDSGPDAVAHMQDIFRGLTAYNENFDKVRWLDEQGMERVRVGHVDGHVVPVPSGQLQNLADSYYFKDTMRLRPGQIFISPLDLNVEHDRVEVPNKPVLRLATPVQDRHGQRRGILVINVAARHMLDEFTDSVGDKRDHVMLVNPQGYTLRSNNPSADWGFMLKGGDTLASRHPAAWKAISAMPSSQLELDDGLWTWSTAYPLKTERNRDVANIPYWLVISHIPGPRLAWVQSDAWKSVGGGALVLLGVFGALTAWLALALVGRNRAELEKYRAQGETLSAMRMAEAQQRFRLVVEANANGLLVVDGDGRIVMTNPALIRMFGYGGEDLIGQPLEILLPESARHGHVEQRDAYIRSPVARAMGTGRELHGRRRDGSVFPVEISLSSYTENGKQYVDAVIADISERKLIEQHQAKAEARLQALVRTHPNGLLIVDDTGRVRMANPALEAMFGYEPGELIERDLECLVPVSMRAGHKAMRLQYMRHPVTRSMGEGRELYGQRKDGSNFPIEVGLASFDEDGRVFVQATVVDITERKLKTWN